MQTMTDYKQMLATVFKNSVRSEVKKTNGTAWGETQARAVMLALLEAFIGDDDALLEGTDALLPFLMHPTFKMFNPSSTAQNLEKLPASGFDEHGEPAVGGTFGHPARIVRRKHGATVVAGDAPGV